MAGERVIRIVLTGDSKGAVRAFAEAGGAAEKAQSKMERLHSVGSKMSSVGRTFSAISLPLIGLGGYAIKTAASFQKSMEMIRTQAGASQQEVNRMTAAVKNMAPSVGAGPNELAAGLYHLESTGVRGAKALDLLRISAEGAKVGGANLEDVTNALDAAVVSGVKGVQNYKQAMGALNSVVGAGDMKMQDLADALGTGLLGPMRTYGVSLKDVGGALAVFGDNNIRGAEAATKLQSAIRIMAAPSAAASKALGAIGFVGRSALQLSTDMHSPGGLVSAFKDLRSHLAGLTSEQRGLVLTRAFGGRQSTGVQLLLSQLPRLQQKVADVARGAGGFGTAWQATQKTVSFQFDKLKAVGETAMVGLGNSLIPIVTRWLPKLVHAVTDVIHWISHLPKPVKDVVIGLTLFLAIGGPILIFLGNLVSGIAAVGGALEFLAANPVVLIIGAVVALGVGLVVAYNKLKWFHDLVNTVFSGIASVVGTVVGFIKAHWQLLVGILLTPIFGPVAIIVGIFHRQIPGVIRGAVGVIKDVWHTVVGILEWPFKEAWKIIKGIVHAITGAVHTVTHLPGTILGGIGHGISSVGNFFGGLFHDGGEVRRPVRHMAFGGPLGGYGGGDIIPVMAEPGEFVLRKEAAQQIGFSALNSINQTGSLAGVDRAPGTLYLTIPLTVKLPGGRVLTETVVHTAAKKAAVSGQYVSG